MITRLTAGDTTVTLIGTAHVSKESADTVQAVIEAEQPDTVCVELCNSRYEAIRNPNRWQNMDIIKVIKEKKAFLLLSNLLLASFQKRIAEKFEIKPGQEMLTAIDTADRLGAKIHLADRDIQVTLSRTWRIMGFWEKMKMMAQLVMSMGDTGSITEEDIERMKQEDVLETLLSDVGDAHPVLREILIDERDRYLTHQIRTAPGNHVVAIVGAGHVPGIRNYWNTEINPETLSTIPPKSRFSGLLKWIIPILILALIGAGFFWGGSRTGSDMILWWVAANGICAGLGAIIALAHPYTILSAIAAAPLTSLNPMIAAGWVSGLVEAFTRKPKVMDLEQIQEDILSVRGFWRNKVTRILLVVVFTNLGSTVGTMTAIPVLMKLMGGGA
ncbi:MAG: conjugal transfer protein TraB [Deltaproteobacteria bacterium]|nr:MAG: conjugal transfer protein TraB [Deltaproteobacteria bacterium]